MATLDQSGRVLDDELAPVKVTARKIDTATGEPLPVLEEFGITGQRIAGINWPAVIVAGILGMLLFETMQPRRGRR